MDLWWLPTRRHKWEHVRWPGKLHRQRRVETCRRSGPAKCFEVLLLRGAVSGCDVYDHHPKTFAVLHDELDITASHHHCVDKCVLCASCRVRWFNFVFLKDLPLYGGLHWVVEKWERRVGQSTYPLHSICFNAVKHLFSLKEGLKNKTILHGFHWGIY